MLTLLAAAIRGILKVQASAYMNGKASWGGSFAPVKTKTCSLGIRRHRQAATLCRQPAAPSAARRKDLPPAVGTVTRLKAAANLWQEKRNRVCHTPSSLLVQEHGNEYTSAPAKSVPYGARLLVILIGVIIPVHRVSAQTNLVGNGGFETGAFAPWVASGNVTIESVPNGRSEGTWAAHFSRGDQPANGVLRQSVVNARGARLRLSFDIITYSCQGFQAGLSVTVFACGESLLQVSHQPGNQGTSYRLASYEHEFDAPPGTIDCEFRDITPFGGICSDAVLDNVRLTTVSDAALVTPPLTTACPSTSASFTASAIGAGPFNYLWRHNSIAIDAAENNSALSPTLVLSNVHAADAGLYDCIVTNACGRIVSKAAVLEVAGDCCSYSVDPRGTYLRSAEESSPQGPPPGPTTISLASCGVLAGQPVYLERYGDFEYHGVAGQVLSAASGLFSSSSTVLPDRSLLDRVPGALAPTSAPARCFPWATPATFNGNLLTDIPQDFLIDVACPLVVPAGAQYLMVSPLDEYHSDNTDFNNDYGVRIYRCAAPVIGLQPQGLQACGGPVSFHIQAVNFAPFSYQWRKDGVAINTGVNQSAASDTLQLLTTTQADDGMYDCVVSNACGLATSVAVRLGIAPPGCTTDCTPPVVLSHPIAVEACLGATVMFSTTAASIGGGACTYQWRHNGNPIPVADNASASTTALTLPVVSARSAGSYDCVVTSPTGCGAVTTATATLTIGGPACTPSCAAPTVTSQPQSVIACPSRAAYFRIGATGTPPFSYSWRRNGVPINTQYTPSAATNTLMLPNVQRYDEATYDCVVTDSGGCGPATSLGAALHVGGHACGFDAWDKLDFNGDGVVNQGDPDAFMLVFAGGDCPTGDCGSLDFNHDGTVDASDPQDFGFAFLNRNNPPPPPCVSTGSGTYTYSFKPPGVDLPISLAVPVNLTISPCLEENSIGFLGASYNLERAEGGNSVQLAGEYKGYGALEDGTDILQSLSEGEGWDSFGGGIGYQPCPVTGQQDIGAISGGILLYSLHIGPGGPLKQKATHSFHLCDTFAVESAGPVALEVPVRIEGEVNAVETGFGDLGDTKATASMEISGSIGGMAIQPGMISVESTSNIFPTTEGIARTEIVPIPANSGTTYVPIDISGKVVVEAIAQSDGLWGVLPAGAQAWADYPHTIAVGMFRGAGGGPVPPGVRITSLETGAVLVDTTGYCAGRNALCNASFEQGASCWVSQPAGREAVSCLPGAAHAGTCGIVLAPLGVVLQSQAFHAAPKADLRSLSVWAKPVTPGSPCWLYVELGNSQTGERSGEYIQLASDGWLPYFIHTRSAAVPGTVNVLSIEAKDEAGNRYSVLVDDVDLRVDCRADYNCSGAVSVQDIFDFLSGYFTGSPRADINHSGAISVQDIFDFLAAYFAGCN